MFTVTLCSSHHSTLPREGEDGRVTMGCRVLWGSPLKPLSSEPPVAAYMLLNALVGQSNPVPSLPKSAHKTSLKCAWINNSAGMRCLLIHPWNRPGLSFIWFAPHAWHALAPHYPSPLALSGNAVQLKTYCKSLDQSCLKETLITISTVLSVLLPRNPLVTI